MKQKYILLNNISSKYSLNIKFGQIYVILLKKLWKYSTKYVAWKLVPGSIVFIKNQAQPLLVKLIFQNKLIILDI